MSISTSSRIPPNPHHTSRAQLIAASPRPATTLSFSLSPPTSPSPSIFDVLIYFVTAEQIVSRTESYVKLLTESQVIDWGKPQKKSICWIYPQLTNENNYVGGVGNHNSSRILLIGIGREKQVNIETIRNATNSAIKAIRKKSKTAAILIPTLTTLSIPSILDAIVRISTLSNHTFSKYLSHTPFNTLHSLTLITPTTSSSSSDSLSSPSLSLPLPSLISSSQTIAECTLLARELANDRADTVDPLYMEQISRSIVETHSGELKLTVVQEEELKKEGLELIVAVGQAGKERSRIVMIEYSGKKDSGVEEKEIETIALVGKGITFDTGGLNLKPTGGIEEMYLDMSGSAAVLAAIKAIAVLQPRNIKVIGVLALAENAIDSLAIKPHTILNTVKGSVMIANTDAEGRLVLADAFTYVQRKRPDVGTIVDIATLTGACVVALGHGIAGLFVKETSGSESSGSSSCSSEGGESENSSNDSDNSESDTPLRGVELTSDLVSSGLFTSERVWPMPVLSDHRAALSTTYADMRSTAGRPGGASVASAFLQRFVNKGVGHAHIDIAGTAMISKEKDWHCEGGTGFGVQLLVEYVQRRAAKVEKKSEQ